MYFYNYKLIDYRIHFEGIHMQVYQTFRAKFFQINLIFLNIIQKLNQQQYM